MAIPATYRVARDQGVSFSACSMVPGAPGWHGGDRHHRRRRRIVEVVPEPFGVIGRHSEIVKAAGPAGRRKSRAQPRDAKLLLVSAFSLRCASFNPGGSQ